MKGALTIRKHQQKGEHHGRHERHDFTIKPMARLAEPPASRMALNIVAGIWLFISPWVLKFSGTQHALWNVLIVGALVIIFAAWDLGAMQQAGGRRA